MSIIFYVGFFMLNMFLGMYVMTCLDVYCKKNNYDFGDSQLMWVLMYALGISLTYYGVFR